MKYIYKLTNQINQKCYVGQSYKPSQRKAQHFLEGSRDKNQHPLYRSMRKHGIENFTFEIIEECEDSKTDERERFWIAEFDCCNSEKGYNLDVGGRGTQKDHRRSISEALKGNTHCVGRVLSEETRKKLSEAGTRRVVSTETKAKMSASMTGVLSGEKNPMFGRKGAEHPRTSITPEKIAQTKQLLSEGLTNRAIAFQVSISKTMVSRIRNGHIQ